jgi:hypothetical protein
VNYARPAVTLAPASFFLGPVACQSRTARSLEACAWAASCYSARRIFQQPWSEAVNLDASVNTAAAETRPSLSWDARTLLFGRAPGPEGLSDIYVTTRTKVGHGDD